MERFHGKLLDGEHILFERVSGQFEPGDHRGGRVGRLEVHDVVGPPVLATNRPYRLALDDGRAEAVYLTGLCSHDPTGPPVVAFRVSET